MASSTTSWYPYVRRDRDIRHWLLDDGSVMAEPPLETTSAQRRVRVAGVPDVADYLKNIEDFLGRAARVAAAQQGRFLWMSLGKAINNPLDGATTVATGLTDISVEVRPHFLSGGRSYNEETRVAWRFRHPTMPIEAQIECSVSKRGYTNTGWTVNTTLTYPSTSPLCADTPKFFAVTEGTRWGQMVAGQEMYGLLNTRLSEWADKNPIDWCDGFEFGARKFEQERAAIDAFAKVIREVGALDEIEIPNLLKVDSKGEDVDGQMQMLTLRLYKTNATQELLETLSDYLTGEPVVDQIKAKWKELSALFRNLGMVIEDPKDTDWWNFLTKGADQAPIEVSLRHVTDEAGEGDQARHSVMINLATGTIVVACSKQASKDETAVAWETSLLKAEITGQKDRFLAYADKYVEDRQEEKARALMKTSLAQARSKK